MQLSNVDQIFPKIGRSPIRGDRLDVVVLVWGKGRTSSNIQLGIGLPPSQDVSTSVVHVLLLYIFAVLGSGTINLH